MLQDQARPVDFFQSIGAAWIGYKFLDSNLTERKQNVVTRRIMDRSTLVRISLCQSAIVRDGGNASRRLTGEFRGFSILCQSASVTQSNGK